MRIKVTEIEATAQELKSCNSVADGVIALLKNVFAPQFDCDDTEEEEDGADNV